jgi:PAS domain S-box-containing protein
MRRSAARDKEGGSKPPFDSAQGRQGEWEKKERHLWRVSLLFLALLATGLAVNSWETIRMLPTGPLRLEGLPVGVLLLAFLFAGYVWHKKREIDQMRGFVRALQEREQAPPSETQLERLMEIVTRSQRGYRELIDSFDDLVFALSLDGEVRAANKRVAEVFDLPFSEIVGRKLDDLVEEPTQAQAEKGLTRFLERRHWSGTVRVRIKRTLRGASGQPSGQAGAVRYLECILHPILQPDAPAGPGDLAGGKEAAAKIGSAHLTGIGGIGRDVTQLRESETRFSELFETLQEGVYFTTPDGKLLDANPALVRMLGYGNKEELFGVSVNELYWDPAERQTHLEEIDRLGMIPSQEITLRRKDGQPVVCLDTSTAIRDSLGRVTRYQGTLLDVTQRREMEKRLRTEQEFARRMIECLPDSIVVLDTEGRYTYASPRITEQLGYEPEELVGRSLGERSDPDDRRALMRAFRELIEGIRPSVSLEYRTQHKDGSWRRFRASAGPIAGDDGRISGVIASARDITQLHQLEQQLLQSEKLAAMGQMIAGVAHELNNPLTAILGVSDLIRERARQAVPQQADLARHAELAHQQARRAAEIVQNLLAFARPPALKKAPVSLNDLVRRTLQLHEYALRVNNIEVDFVAAPGLPPVVADPSQLVQVFLNLVINAEQAMREPVPAEGSRAADAREMDRAAGRPAGQQSSGASRGTLRVRLGRRAIPAPEGVGDGANEPFGLLPQGEQVWVSFADDGPGISPEILPKIFDPFFTTKRPGRGTGLGLSICLAIMKEHGGIIDAQSVPGQGATFTVYLPLAPQNGEGRSQNAERGQTGARSPETSGESGARRACRVLVVEDEPSIRELVRDGLGTKGMEIECVGSGSEAVAEAAAAHQAGQPYDVILCDMKMPGMNGDQVFEKLKTRPDGSPQPFVFMTGDLADAETLEFLHGQKARSISKPFRVSDLVNVLEEVIERETQNSKLRTEN